MHLSKLSLILTIGLILSACGGGGSGDKKPTTPPVTPPVVENPPIQVELSGPTEVAEGTQVTVTADTDASGEVTFEWGIYSDYDISPEVFENRITFTTPKLYENAATSIDVTVTVSANGESSLNYGFPVLVLNQYTFEDKYDVVSTASLGAAESYTSLADIVRNSINLFVQSPEDIEQYCGYVGNIEMFHTDADANGMLSAGDNLRLEYTECAVSYDTKLYGSLEITFETLSTADKSVSGLVVLNNLIIEQSFSDIITIEGQLDFAFSESETLRSSNISHDQALIFKLNDAALVDIAHMVFSKTENLLEAQYSIAIEGEMSDMVSQESYFVSTPVPIVGFFGEYPTQGAIELKDENNEVVLISTQDTGDSSLVSIILDGASFEYYWGDLTEYSLFDISTVNNGIPREHYSTNFDSLGSSDAFLQLETPSSKELNYLVSRPITDISEGPFAFRANTYPYEEIQARVEINGTQLTVAVDDVELLRAATEYFLTKDISVFNEANQSIVWNFLSFATSNSVVPRINASVLGYRENDLPVLDASQSILNSGNTLSYEWIDESNSGIVFSTPNASTSTFSLPSSSDFPLADINIALRLSNELGESAIARTTVRYLPAPASYFSMDSEMGDYIGQGYSWLLNEPGAISTKMSQYQDTATSIIYNDNVNNFELIINAPNGQPLAVGEYVDATRIPFQEPASAGMDFSGNARGCNELVGSFNILELAYDENGDIDLLAVDFVQYCEGVNNPPLTGQIRINSSLPINPQ